MANKMQRTNVSTTTKNVDDFSYGEWNGQFIYENVEGKIPTSVQVNAQNGNNNYFSANFSDSNINFNFSGGQTDTSLVSAVASEYEAITNPTS